MTTKLFHKEFYFHKRRRNNDKDAGKHGGKYYKKRKNLSKLKINAEFACVRVCVNVF